MEAVFYEHALRDRTLRLERLQKACTVILQDTLTRKDIHAIGLIVNMPHAEPSLLSHLPRHSHLVEEQHEKNVAECGGKEKEKRTQTEELARKQFEDFAAASAKGAKETIDSNSINSRCNNTLSFSDLLCKTHMYECKRRLELAAHDIRALHEWCKQFYRYNICECVEVKTPLSKLNNCNNNNNVVTINESKYSERFTATASYTKNCSSKLPHFYIIARIAPRSIDEMLIYMNWQTSLHACRESPLRHAHIILLSMHHLSLLLPKEYYYIAVNHTEHLDKNKTHQHESAVKDEGNKEINLSLLVLHHQYLMLDLTWMISTEDEQEVELREIRLKGLVNKRKKMSECEKKAIDIVCNIDKDLLIELFFNEIYPKLLFPKHQSALWLSYNTLLSSCSNQYSMYNNTVTVNNSDENHNDEMQIQINGNTNINDTTITNITNKINANDEVMTEYMKRFRIIYKYLHKANAFPTFSYYHQHHHHHHNQQQLEQKLQHSENSFAWRLCCAYGGTVENLCLDAFNFVKQCILVKNNKLHKEQSWQTMQCHNLMTKTFHLRALRDIYALISVWSGRDGTDLYNEAYILIQRICHRLGRAAQLSKFYLSSIPLGHSEQQAITSLVTHSSKKRIRVEELESDQHNNICQRKRANNTSKSHKTKNNKAMSNSRTNKEIQFNVTPHSHIVGMKKTAYKSNKVEMSANTLSRSTINELIPLEWEESVEEEEYKKALQNRC